MIFASHTEDTRRILVLWEQTPHAGERTAPLAWAPDVPQVEASVGRLIETLGLHDRAPRGTRWVGPGPSRAWVREREKDLDAERKKMRDMAARAQVAFPIAEAVELGGRTAHRARELHKEDMQHAYEAVRATKAIR